MMDNHDFTYEGRLYYADSRDGLITNMIVSQGTDKDSVIDVARKVLASRAFRSTEWIVVRTWTDNPRQAPIEVLRTGGTYIGEKGTP